ncbi:LOW QUALITY PROTEIN: uncharacterized protein Z518_05579 [Rhinocladiella mackenziei CBS 650.93]|uniref:Rhinocladiella mackenziei CBS 650.93 unplaced genomic scaffold supercont1.4, whole genome shotgun sequence n=1 Tax=Rhinocladiella mackenziei CBS 650.93 TaxID=1442369 RepID=A0A0D2IFX4_9EURO|nr:LOW QUALITY PROTEIN: uncharacterized protein Z518_05579 [Rhinocladiella mackenziei CBS 650.93]KIX04709.1 LOW QUALITY PROTEIN: hypothetical protein Z518_05579 [Rhinocladiella mackenziei CBS 650.93]
MNVAPHGMIRTEFQNIERAAASEIFQNQHLRAISQAGAMTRTILGLEKAGKDLTTYLEGLALQIEDHLDHLTRIEEPLRRLFIAETLKIQTSSIVQSAQDKRDTQEVALSSQVSNFRKLRRKTILAKLWDDWEDIQGELVCLAAEVFGQENITIVEAEDEDMKTGQKERLDNVFKSAQRTCQEENNAHRTLERDLDRFGGDMGEEDNG